MLNSHGFIHDEEKSCHIQDFSAFSIVLNVKSELQSSKGN